jgi:hypothetical protein
MGRGIRSTDRQQPRPRPAVYPVLIDVHDHSREWADGTVIPWCAVIGPAPEAPHPNIAPRLVSGETLVELWHVVHDQLEEVGDEVGMIVGGRWSLEGDNCAWATLRDREGLTTEPAGVPTQRGGASTTPRSQRAEGLEPSEASVEPAQLFSLERGEEPPWDSVDVYLDAPASLSKLWLRAGRELPPEKALGLRNAINAWRATATHEAIKSLQRESAYVKRGDHVPDPTRRHAVRSPADLQWERSVGISLSRSPGTNCRHS